MSQIAPINQEAMEPAMTESNDSNPTWPRRSYAWYVAAILTAAYTLSYIDRQVLCLPLLVYSRPAARAPGGSHKPPQSHPRGCISVEFDDCAVRIGQQLLAV